MYEQDSSWTDQELCEARCERIVSAGFPESAGTSLSDGYLSFQGGTGLVPKSVRSPALAVELPKVLV